MNAEAHFGPAGNVICLFFGVGVSQPRTNGSVSKPRISSDSQCRCGRFLEVIDQDLNHDSHSCATCSSSVARRSLQTYLFLETHIKHTVGFIQHEVCDAAEVGGSTLQEVDKATGGSDEDFDAAAKGAGLRSTGGAAVHHSVLNVTAAAKAIAFFLNLNGELASGGQDKDDGAIARLQVGLSIDMNHSWEKERQSFATARHGNADNIASRQSHRPALGLDGGGFLETS